MEGPFHLAWGEDQARTQQQQHDGINDQQESEQEHSHIFMRRSAVRFSSWLATGFALNPQTGERFFRLQACRANPHPPEY
jgi:hypothetical protein